MRHFHAITLKQLRGLAAVVRTGGVSNAARALGVTAPAVSTQLRALEGNVGVALLARDAEGRPVPTAVGAELLAMATQIESALAHCARNLAALGEGRAGVANLGVVSTAKYFAPRFVAVARQQAPGIEVNLKVGNRDEIVAALLSGEIDLAIMGRAPVSPLLVAEPLGPHPHVLIAPPGHPLTRRYHVPVEQLLGETFLLREPGSGTRAVGERWLDQLAQGRDYARVEFGTNETIKQGVMAGLGISLISGHTVVAELESGRLQLIHAAGLPLVRRWFHVHRTAMASVSSVATVARLLVAQRAAYLPDLTELVRRRPV